VAPPDLSLYIDQMIFVYKELEYRFFVNAERREVRLDVRYPEGARIGEALQTYRRPGDEAGSVTWTATQTKFTLYNDSPRVESQDAGPDEGKGKGKGKDQGKSEGKGKGKGKGG